MMLRHQRPVKWQPLLMMIANLTLTLEGSESVALIPPLRPFRLCGQCICEGTVVDCSSRNLTTIPTTDLPANITQLSLRENFMSRLGPRAFKGFHSLKRLDLSFNTIGEISNDAFEGLVVLRELNLSCNLLNLDDVYLGGPFDRLISLSRLDLSNNSLAGMHPLVLRGLNSSLTRLDLSRNQISYNGEAAWPIQLLVNLRYLGFAHNNLTSISRGMFKKGLVALDLAHNHIPLTQKGYATDAFEDVKLSLLYLNLSGNCNTSDDSGLLAYPDKALSPLQNLRELWIDGVPSKRFGPGFRNLVRLEELRLSGKWGGYCFMHTLSNDTFENLGNALRVLDLSLCSIREIEANAFAPLADSLHVLDLSYNVALGFDTLGDAFYGLRGSILKRLYVDSIVKPLTMCSTITERNTRFFPNTSLEFISARQNRLEIFCEGALNNMPPTLQRASLYGNRLGFGRYLKDLKNLVGLEELEVDGQPLAPHLPVHFPNADVGKCQASYTDGSHCDVGRHQLYTFTGHEHADLYGETDAVYVKLLQNRDHENLSIELPPNLKTFKSRWNQLYFRLENIRFDFDNSLADLTLQYNLLTAWVGGVTGLHKLETLNLQGNLAFEIDTHFFNGFQMLKTLKLSKNSMRKVVRSDEKGDLFAHLDKLEVLDISRNNINQIQRQIFRGLVSLKSLNASYNYINDFNVNITHMRNLSMLDLSFNNIKYLTQEVMEHLGSIADSNHSMEVKLDLTYNPLACTCQHMDFLRWVEMSNVVLPASEDYTCLMADGNHQRLIDIFSVIKELNTSCIDKLGVLVGAVTCAFCLLLAVMSALVYRFRWKLRYLYYASRLAYKRQENANLGDDFVFDAFVSYSSEDNDFVHGLLLDELETQAGLRLNVHNRDFTPGRPIPSNIVSAVQSSRRTLVVLSRELLQSDWCHYEMQMATMEAAHTGRDVLLFLLYEDVPSQQLPRDVLYNLQASTYIAFPGKDAEPARLRDFWARLAQAVKQG